MVYSSIVIFDFKRPNFIRKEIDFLLKEILGTDSEIILIKSYTDPEIEKFLNDNKIVYADLMTDNKQSDYIKAACRIATGEVIIFMDDDDIFYPGKIRYVSNLFKEKKGLGYYHNNFDTIDESDNIKINRNYITPDFKTLYIYNSEKPEFFRKTKNMKRMLKIRPDFNSSSIAIRRSLLLEYHENYDFNVRPDSFIFALALMSQLDIMLDSRVLTHYRLYRGNVSTSYNTTVNKLQETFMEAFSSGISMFGIIQDITRASAYENYVELRIINLKLAYNFWSLTKTYKINFHGKLLVLRVNFIHESAYMALSAMPAFIKRKAMKIFYHAKDN